YKIQPIERKIRELLGLKPRQHWPRTVAVEQIFGISADEMRRMRMPRELWRRNRYPFIFERRMQRWQIIEAARKRFPDHPFPRSACIGCPFHSDAEWLAMQRSRPAEFADAVAFDEA